MKHYEKPASAAPRGFVLLAFLLFALGAFAWGQEGEDSGESEYSGPVTISRIKISIDDYLYVWDRESAEPLPSPDNPPDAQAPKTKPMTVMSLIGIKPGDSFSEKSLERLAELREKQLSDTNLFFSNRLTILPVRGDQSLRSLRVDLRVGFPWRPYGGAAYAALGNENADGNLLTWSAILGYNLDAFSVGRGSSKAGPFWWNAGIFYSNNLLSGLPAEHSLGLNASLGSAWLPLSPYLAMETWGSYSVQSAAICEYGIKFLPGISWSKLIGRENLALALGVTAQCSIPMLAPDFAPLWQPLAMIQVKPILGPLCLALQAGGGMTSAHSDRFPLYANVRGGFADSETTVMDRYAQFNAELRVNPGILSLPVIITTLDVMPYGFFDLAAGERDVGGSLSSSAIFAGGIGLKLRFGIPVMIGFDLSYGWSDEGLGRFCFAFGTGY